MNSFWLVVILESKWHTSPKKNPARSKMSPYIHKRLKGRFPKQYKRPRANPGRSNRHVYTNKDMRS